MESWLSTSQFGSSKEKLVLNWTDSLLGLLSADWGCVDPSLSLVSFRKCFLCLYCVLYLHIPGTSTALSVSLKLRSQSRWIWLIATLNLQYDFEVWFHQAWGKPCLSEHQMKPWTTLPCHSSMRSLRSQKGFRSGFLFIKAWVVQEN